MKNLTEIVRNLSELNKSKIVENIVHNPEEKHSHGSLAYWLDRLEKGNPLWYSIKPFSDKNDPLYGITPRMRAALLRELTTAPIDTTPLSVSGLDLSAWKRFYVDEWHLELKKRNPDLFKIQNQIVAMYSERLVSLRIDYMVTGSPPLKRGMRGNLLSMEALSLLPQKFSSPMRQSIKDKGNTLCHIQGVILVLPPADLKYPKK